jgi:hypothetical protein
MAGEPPLEPNASDVELIDAVQKMAPGIDNFVRVDKLNQIFSQRGNPLRYLPEHMFAHMGYRRAIEAIGGFHTIVEEMFQDFLTSKNSGFTDLKQFTKRIEQEFDSLSPTIDANVRSFLSKTVSFIQAMAKAIEERHPDTPDS